MAESNGRKPGNQHKLITAVLAVIVIVVLLVLAKGLNLNPTVVKSTQIGKEAWPFEVDVLAGESWLPATNNHKVQLKDLRGRVVVLNFWASWCVSCREEAAELERFWSRVKERNIIVLGVAIQDTPEAATEFAKAHGKTYPIAIDSTGRTGIDFGVYGVPETFIIDRDGKILFKEAAPVTAQYLDEQLVKLGL
jgi:cytochrome c biogenesis protein CcmG/thiol:disulfide interchange protein DsbE